MAMKLASSVALFAFSRTSLALHHEQNEEVTIDATGAIEGVRSDWSVEVGEWGLTDREEIADFKQRVEDAEVGEPLSEDLLQEEEGALVSSWFGNKQLSLRFEPLDDADIDDEDDDEDTAELIIANATTDAEILAGMSKTKPTPWRYYYNRQVCQEARKEDRNKNYFEWCQTGKPIIYSKQHKVGYMKTPKAASTAIFAYFKKQFKDAKIVSAKTLPKDAFIFTFVRTPFEQKLSGYAEVDLKENANKKYGATQETKFQDVPRTDNHGRERFRTFLEDIEHKRFKIDDKRKPSHAASQISGVMCTHEVDFIGHLERVGPDWKRIQKLAKLPNKLRTKALPIIHEGENKKYLYDENIPLNTQLERKLCQMYKSDFACLGYAAFDHCKQYIFGK